MIILKKLYINPIVDLSYIFRRFHEILRDEYNSFCEYCTFVKDNRYIIYNSENLNISSIKLSFISDYPLTTKSILGFKCDDSTYYLSNPNDADISEVVHLFVDDCKHYDVRQEEDIEKVRNNMSKIILGIKDGPGQMNIFGFEGNYSIETGWDNETFGFNHHYYRGGTKITLETNRDGLSFASFKGALNYIYGGRSGYQRDLATLKYLETDNLRINYHMFGISKVISNEPATIVFWKDGTKTVVKCQEGDTYDLEKGILYAIIRKVYGEGREYTNILNIIDESCETYDNTKANEAFWNYKKEVDKELMKEGTI